MQAFGLADASVAAATVLNSVPIPAPNSIFDRYAPLPLRASCEVLISVQFSSVNPSDLHPTVALNDSYPKPLGSDVAGCIVAVNNRHGASKCKSGLSIGDCVWGDIGANTHVGGQKTKELGGYSQFAIALDTQLALTPVGMPMQVAGSLPKVALTSLKAFDWYAGYPRRGDGANVLILGGSSGTGLAGIQLARYYNASSITTTTSAQNFDLVREFGATAAIDYHTTNWWEAVPDGSQDFVYDCVDEGQEGKFTGDRAVRKLRPGGSYVTIVGALAKGPLPPNVTQHMFINSDTNLDSVDLLKKLSWIAEGRHLRMPVDSTFDLSDVGSGFNRSATRHSVGKISIRVPAPTDEQKQVAATLWRVRRS